MARRRSVQPIQTASPATNIASRRPPAPHDLEPVPADEVPEPGTYHDDAKEPACDEDILANPGAGLEREPVDSLEIS